MDIALHNLHSKIRRKKTKTVGRGNASGHGTFSTRGIKGQHARSGGSHPAGFEGGRSSIIVQTPKMRGKGFISHRPRSVGVNVEALNVFDNGENVTVVTLMKRGIIESGPVKILGEGKLSKKLTVNVPASASARDKIEKAGGKIELPPPHVHVKHVPKPIAQ